MYARVAIKVLDANQQVLRVFMSDEVRQRNRYLQDVNLGMPSRATSVEVLTWGAGQMPPWSLLGAIPSSRGTSILYVGPRAVKEDASP